MGYINHGRVREGAIIEIEPKQFSKNWMEKLEEDEFVPAKKKPKVVKEEQADEPGEGETPI